MKLKTLYAASVLGMVAPWVQADETGLENWAKINQVFSHPRCANCHVDAGAVPMWSGPEYGPVARPHGMNIQGGASRTGAENGLSCNSCHTARNSDLPHGPPGVADWHLAPASMQWYGKTSGEICAQIKDKARNGGPPHFPHGRTLDQIADHIQSDPAVRWGWNPGPGRAPPPYSPDLTATLVRKWMNLGAPCPAP